MLVLCSQTQLHLEQIDHFLKYPESLNFVISGWNHYYYYCYYFCKEKNHSFVNHALQVQLAWHAKGIYFVVEPSLPPGGTGLWGLGCMRVCVGVQPCAAEEGQGASEVTFL